MRDLRILGLDLGDQGPSIRVEARDPRGVWWMGHAAPDGKGAWAWTLEAAPHVHAGHAPTYLDAVAALGDALARWCA